MPNDSNNTRFMARALELAARGRGLVEPNPMVGCVLVQEGQIVGEGWHQKYGGPHAEIEALKSAGARAAGATAYVTLEPCCHTGKTPPCANALVQAGVCKVVLGCRDPNPQVSGGGIQQLRDANIEVLENILSEECEQLIAPFTKLMVQKKPWVIAKWAMTLDGKLATRTGSSQWISGEQSRQHVHHLRGLVDAILVGRQTVEKDNPLLTARPAGPRTPLRIVLDSQATLPDDCQLLQTVREAPLLVAVSQDAPLQECDRLNNQGAEIIQLSGNDKLERLTCLLDHLGQRQITNLLVEGGAQVLGSFFDLRQIDEIHTFIAPRLAGGAMAPSPLAGQGIAEMATSLQLHRVTTEVLGDDVHLHGFVQN